MWNGLMTIKTRISGPTKKDYDRLLLSTYCSWDLRDGYQ